MTSRLNPYLTFNGDAREAMEFYQSVFGGRLNIATFGDFGAGEGIDANGVMHANLVTDLGFTLMASDTPPGEEATSGTMITCSLSGDDADVLSDYWERLSERGQVQMPLEAQMWGDVFGMCIDRFGIPWLVNIASEPPP